MKKIDTHVDETTNATNPNLTKSLITKEQEIEKARVQAVKDRIEAARLKRIADKVVETPDEKSAREASEAKELKQGLTKEEQAHIDVAHARVKVVQDAIVAAKLARDEQEKAGVMETPGAKSDREAKEAKDLKEAAVVNKLEPISLGSSPLSDNSDLGAIVLKVNELIKFLNK